MTQTQFDNHATDYEKSLKAGLRLTGEGAEYYAQQRTRWTAMRCRRLGRAVRAVLDFGCGTGIGTSCLLDAFPDAHIIGVDVSQASLAVARSHHADGRVSFRTEIGDDRFDLVYCNGVFHHIPPAERPGVLAQIAASLAPEGLFALWENNPWNPGTRLVMSRVDFDRDAITLSMPQSRGMLRDCGFAPLSADSLFYFPSQLRFARPLERLLHKLPLGGQYLVLSRAQSKASV